MTLQYWIEATECVCRVQRPIGACLHCDMVALQARLNDLLGTIDAAGGVLQRGEETLGMAGEPKWYGLADAYVGLCTLLERDPVVTKEDV